MGVPDRVRLIPMISFFRALAGLLNCRAAARVTVRTFPLPSIQGLTGLQVRRCMRLPDRVRLAGSADSSGPLLAFRFAGPPSCSLVFDTVRMRSRALYRSKNPLCVNGRCMPWMSATAPVGPLPQPLPHEAPPGMIAQKTGRRASSCLALLARSFTILVIFWTSAVFRAPCFCLKILYL